MSVEALIREPLLDPKAVMQAVLKACKKVEPDCEIAL